MSSLADADPRMLMGFITNHLAVDMLLIVIIIIGLVFSAFFSSIETALSSVSLIRLKKMADDKIKGARKAVFLIENYERTLITILIGNNLTNIGASTVSAFIFSKLLFKSATLSSFVSTFLMTFLIITFSEILPKTYAKNHATKVSIKFAGMMWFFYKIFFPVAFFFVRLQRKFVKNQSENSSVTGEELETIIDTMEDEGLIDEDHADIIQGALSLGNKTVGDIMTPRVDMISVKVNDSVDSILEEFFKSQYSRLPVYEEDKDNILGILQEKDFLTNVIKNKDKIDLKKLIQKPLYVTRSTKVDDLIKEMQEVKKHFAIVADEYGGTSGIVTMEDALEELVGEIYDEYDEEEAIEIIKLNDNSYDVSPELTIEELSEELDLEILKDSNQYQTIGNVVYDLCEELPEEGDEVTLESFKTTYEEEKTIETNYSLIFQIKKVVNRRIRKLTLKVVKIEENKA
ncbi:MAG: hemolysin family protein [Acholeplasmatales bacterium]|nr:hemolysin family protein [Acholeplasmatales bacterium]